MYNKSEIFKIAHKYAKVNNVSFSVALKKAWLAEKLSKSNINQITDYVFGPIGTKERDLFEWAGDKICNISDKEIAECNGYELASAKRIDENAGAYKIFTNGNEKFKKFYRENLINVKFL